MVFAISVGLCFAGVVFLVLLRLRAGEWDVSGPLARGLIATTIAVACIAGLALFATMTGAGFGRVACTGLGAFLAYCTLFRPRWFWEHGRARAARALFGDAGTALIYLVVAAALLGLGLFARMPLGPQP